MRLFRFAAALVLCALLASGCAGDPATRAAAVRDSTEREADKIQQAAAIAQASMVKADAAVVTAATQPANPPSTNRLLKVAHDQINKASNSLAPIAGSTAAIKNYAVAGADLTMAEANKNKKLEASFFSPRQKRLGYLTLGLLLIAGLVIGAIELAAKVGGISPLLDPAVAVAGDVLSSMLNTAWSGIKLAFKTVYHVGTLGLARIGSELGTAIAAKASAQTSTLKPAA